MIKGTSFAPRCLKLLVILLLVMCSVQADANTLIMHYERVVRDSWGNEIGFSKQRIYSPDDLPVGSPWRNYLNIRLNDGKTIFQYASETSSHLSRPLYLNLSDRNNTAYTKKLGNQGYEISLFNYVNNFASDDSKRFLFLHEFGHVAMLNAYPPSYDFVGLDYGDDGVHYLDEILPNHNTAWVEGWANAFAAQRNNGMIFTIDVKNPNSVAFLRNNSFDEMTRNELFIAKILYDNMFKISNGRAKVFDAISRSGPHYSLLSFCRGYLNLYPNDRVALARILVENTHGKMTLDDILNYVNGGSRTVSRELYDYLAGVGLVSPTPGQVAQPTGQQPTTGGGGFFDRIFSWFSGWFNRSRTGIAASPSPSGNASAPAPPPSDIPASGARPPSMPPAGAATSPQPYLRTQTDLGMTLAEAQESYYKAFFEYNRVMADTSSSQEQIKAAAEEVKAAKDLVDEIRQRMRDERRQK